MHSNKQIIYLLTLLAVALSSLITFAVQNQSPKKEVAGTEIIETSQAPIEQPTPPLASSTTLEIATVVSVVDGDTIKLDNGKTVRYIGIDTPETVDPRRPDGCFGKEASDYNKRLVQGMQVLLEKDVSQTDRYGRLLRYVYLPAVSGSNSGEMVNELLVKNGYAHSSTYPPDVKYQDLFTTAESQARENNLGLWNKCQN